MNRFVAFSLIFFSTLIAFTGLTQNEHNIWYFGRNAGIDFNSGTAVALTDGAMNTFEGCSSRCDENGDLLFYANPTTVWDRQHNIMPNGGALLGDTSSTQGALIVPLPGSTDTFYIFTASTEITPQGLSYSIVDMSLNSGLGNVVQNTTVPNSNSIAEKICVIRHANGEDYWIVVFDFELNTYVSYLLSDSGLTTPPVQSTISQSIADGVTYVGCLKGSPDGSKIASANYIPSSLVQLFDFDKSTGLLFNGVTLDSWAGFDIPYGVEFSPNGSLLYVSVMNLNQSMILQYDLTAGTLQDILNSKVQLTETYNGFTGTLQLAPDQKIYLARHESEYLGVIEFPNTYGNGCNYTTNGFFLNGRRSAYGLPNFLYSDETTVSHDGLCLGDPTNFEAIGGTYDSLLWDFGDPASGAANTSDLANTSHSFSATGTYTVTLTTYSNGDATTITQIVQIGQAPSVELGELPLNCEPDTFLLDATSTVTASYLWQDLSTSPTYTVTSPGLYWVQLSNACGSVSDSVLYEVIDCSFDLEMPNVFTPNSDLTNDTFHPTKLEGLEKAELIILNRWGDVVFKTEDLSIGWDGTYNDGECPEGTYFWEVNYSTVEGLKDTAHGFVTLVR